MNVIFASSQNGRIESEDAHVHDCYEIIFMLEGCCFIYINDEEFLMNENSVAVIPPGVVHGSLSADGFRTLFIQVDRLPAVQDTPFVFTDQTGELRNLVELIYTTWIRKEYNYRSISSSLLAVVNDYIVKFQNKGYHYGFVCKLKENIANNFTNGDFDLKEVNLELGVSKDYLRHCFKKVTGFTPLEYLMNMRIQQSKTYLIQNQHMPIEQIALECGFKDGYYFSRCFKKKTGVSPSEFRMINTK